MTWVRLDDSMTEHPKVANLSHAAFRMHIEGLCYSARTLSDGFIPAGIARRLLLSGARRAGAELVAAGVWDAVDGGYAIHDFLEYQPSRLQVLELREKRSEAGRKGGKQTAKQKLEQEPQQNSSTLLKQNPSKPGQANPVNPGPSRTPKREESSDESSSLIAPGPTAKAPRQRDAIWDAFADQCGPVPETKSGRGGWNQAARELRDIQADAGLIPSAVAEAKRRWPGITVTPQTVAKHWTSLITSQNGHVAKTWTREDADKAAAYRAEIEEQQKARAAAAAKTPHEDEVPY